MAQPSTGMTQPRIGQVSSEAMHQSWQQRFHQLGHQADSGGSKALRQSLLELKAKRSAASSVPRLQGIGQLKDQRVSVSKRLDLAHHLWTSNDNVGPNKHQTIIDTVSAILINNKKRQELGKEVEEKVWGTLSTFLQDVCIATPTASQPTVSLRPSTNQIIIDTLERLRHKPLTNEGEVDGVVISVLDCCRHILSSSTLATVFTSGLNVLVSLCAVLCHLARSPAVVKVTCVSEVMSKVSAGLWCHHHRSQLSPTQVLELVTEKLLGVVMRLSADRRALGPSLSSTVISLQDFVLTCVFHEHHQKQFKTYLDCWTKGQDTAHIPRIISNVFAELSGPLQSHKKEANKGKPLANTGTERVAALHFLPQMFAHAVKVWKQNNNMSFQLFTHLCSFIGIPTLASNKEQTTSVPLATSKDQTTPVDMETNEDNETSCVATETSKDKQRSKKSKKDKPGVSTENDPEDRELSCNAMDTSCMGVLCELLSIVGKSGVYKVAVDRSEGGGQLGFFRRVVQILRGSPVCAEAYRCHKELLGLNHLILEPSLPALLAHASSHLPQMDEGCRAALDEWLRHLVSTYSQLHQVPQLYHILLTMGSSDDGDLIHILPLPGFSQQLRTAVGALTHTTALDLWGKLQGDILSLARFVLDDQQSESNLRRLWAISLLLQCHLRQLPVFVWSNMAAAGERISTLMTQLESTIVSPLLAFWEKGNKKRKVCAVWMLLAVCLGDMKVRLAAHRSSHVTLPSPSVTHLPFSIQRPLVMKKTHKSDVDSVIRYLGDMLTVQRLLVWREEKDEKMKEGKQEEEEEEALLGDLVMWGKGDNSTCTWDGQLCHITDKSYYVAQSHLLVYQSDSLLPDLVSRHGDQLAERVVSLLSQSSSSSLPSSSCDGVSGYTCKSVAQHLLQTMATSNTSQPQNHTFLHKVVCSLWRQFTRTNTDDEEKHLLLLSNVLCLMSDVGYCWEDVEDKNIKAVMGLVSDLLKSSDHETFPLSPSHTALLQIFEELPLANLPSGTRLLCTVGLLVVLVHCEQAGGSGWDKVCRLLVELLEVSVGTSLFLVLDPCLMLSCLRTLLVKCAAKKDSGLGQVLKKAVTMVMGDFHSLLHLDPFVSSLEAGWERLGRLLGKKHVNMNKTDHHALLSLSLGVLSGTYRHLRKDFFRQDVMSASRQHFDRLASQVDAVIDIYHKLYPQSSLHPALLRCCTAITWQRCADLTEAGSSLDKKDLERISFVLSSFHLDDDHVKESKRWQTEELDFISCLYHHHSPLSSLLPHSLTLSLWSSLLVCLHDNQAPSLHDRPLETKWRQDIDDLKMLVAKRKRQCNSLDQPPNKVKRLNLGLRQPVKTEMIEMLDSSMMEDEMGGAGEKKRSGKSADQEGGREVGERDEEKEEKILETMTVVLTSCPLSLFTQLLQQVLSSMTSEVRCSVLVWQRVVSCGAITVQQKVLLESFCITMLKECLQVLQRVNEEPGERYTDVCVPVLRCITAMLSQHKLLSTKGTVLCLMCVALVPLSHQGLEEFLRADRAVCDAVHAVLVHHPHTAQNLLHLSLSSASAVLKECIRRGDQKHLLSNPDYIPPMTACAEHVHRLVTLVVGEGVQRVVSTLVSDYTTSVQSLTLLPSVKKWLLSSMYACLDACDKHAVNQLRQRLPPGVREVFHMLHNDYLAFHKYTGKV